ncbi:MAG: transglutaminase domain-containing protein [Lachnospiraceae bacterium]
MRNRKKRRLGCLISIILVFTICFVGVAGYGIYLKLFPSQQEEKQNFPHKKESSIPFQKVDQVEPTIEKKYYYQQLNQEEQLVYQEIVQGIKDQQEEIYMHASTSEMVLRVFGMVLNDSPEFFWCSGDATVTVYPKEDKETSYSVLSTTYLFPREERDRRQQEIDMAVNTCLSGIGANASDYEKIEYVYNYIIQTTDYNMEAPDNQNIYSVLVNRQSVCAGYAKANQYLLEKSGILCIYLTGTSTALDGTVQPHGWNIVQCNNEFYQEDVTWGDPVFSQEDTTMSGITNYDYMLCTDDEIYKTHVIDTELLVPECKDAAYNYFTVHGLYYNTYDANETLKIIKSGIASKLPVMTFKYADEALYRTAYESIMNDLINQASKYLASLYGLTEVQYYYQVNEQMNRITIMWQYG